MAKFQSSLLVLTWQSIRRWRALPWRGCKVGRVGKFILAMFFTDGPKERVAFKHVLISLSITFIPKAEMKEKGYKLFIDYVWDIWNQICYNKYSKDK